ncbi:MAG: glutamate synthase (NADPH/NADH) small [Erysipelotrichaceae bacterium]|nr:MAG: glutamate synthase (NADPH/NADH) small [Erysipelotrichaceae bacterium]
MSDSHFPEQQGYTHDEAVLEARRCLNCKHQPCVDGCVAHMNIPGMIQAFLQGNGDAAKGISSSFNDFSEICGRVCYQEIQCQGSCVFNKLGKPIQIGKLERYISDTYELPAEVHPQAQGHIAIIGSGPAGLACALDCAKAGLKVTVFDKNDEIGGVLRYGIPTYRLPRKVLDRRVNELKQLGVEFLLNQTIKDEVEYEQLLIKYDALMIAVGSPDINTINTVGAEHPKVIGWEYFLKIVNDGTDVFESTFKNVKDILIIGGGNVAMDVAKSAALMNRNVDLIYRRTIPLMPARRVEIEELHNYSVRVHELRDPIKITPFYDQVIVYCKKTKLEVSKEYPRGIIVDDEGTEAFLADLFVLAIGSGNQAQAIQDLNMDENNKIIVDDQQATSVPFVYAAGDAVTGPKTVVHALSSGKRAAKSIIAALSHE